MLRFELAISSLAAVKNLASLALGNGLARSKVLAGDC